MKTQFKPGDRRSFRGTIIAVEPGNYCDVTFDGGGSINEMSQKELQASKPLRKRARMDLGPALKRLVDACKWVQNVAPESMCESHEANEFEQAVIDAEELLRTTHAKQTRKELKR